MCDFYDFLLFIFTAVLMMLLGLVIFITLTKEPKKDLNVCDLDGYIFLDCKRVNKCGCDFELKVQEPFVLGDTITYKIQTDTLSNLFQKYQIGDTIRCEEQIIPN